MFLGEEKRKIWPYVLAGFLLLFFGLAGCVWNKIHEILQIVVEPGKPADAIVAKKTNSGGILDLLPVVGGFARPHTYLILFQNNTELRPGGGFIGTYAIARLNQGKIQIMKIEGTEVLDSNTRGEWRVAPPRPIKKYLGVSNWYFRDSNWSPDFVENVQRAVAFYTGERGYLAGDIDTVVAVTPELLSGVLKRIGPVTVGGKEFNADNATEALEYEVEYGYLDRGVKKIERKKIISDLFAEIAKRTKSDLLLHSGYYIDLVSRLTKEKQVMAYSRDPEVAKFLSENNLTGELANTAGDYLLWVDANLGALKTDHAMDRDIKYEMGPYSSGGLTATTSMRYTHNGKFDWRTTRYLTYARLYVPAGSKLISVHMVGKKNIRVSQSEIDQGQELGKQWFGFFVSIEPKENKSVEVTYQLPDNIRNAISAGKYDLYAQKQAGTAGHVLTLDLKFAKNITSAEPAEALSERGDLDYKISTDLKVDRKFTISF